MVGVVGRVVILVVVLGGLDGANLNVSRRASFLLAMAAEVVVGEAGIGVTVTETFWASFFRTSRAEGSAVLELLIWGAVVGWLVLAARSLLVGLDVGDEGEGEAEGVVEAEGCLL